MPADLPGDDWLALRSVSVAIGARRVLDDVTFTTPRGALALIGNNGAGKSTLLRVLATLQVADGHVTVGGIDLTTWSGVRRARQTLGYLPAEAEAPVTHTVRDAVTYGAWLKRVPRSQRSGAVDQAIEMVGLSDRRNDRLTELSSGLRQRALLAQALVHDPVIVLLDEPTAALDPEQRAEIRRTIRLLATDRMVVFATHLVEDVEHAADHVVALHDGQVAWTGPSAGLIARGRERAAGTDDGTLESALRSFEPSGGNGGR